LISRIIRSIYKSDFHSRTPTRNRRRLSADKCLVSHFRHPFPDPAEKLGV